MYVMYRIRACMHAMHACVHAWRAMGVCGACVFLYVHVCMYVMHVSVSCARARMYVQFMHAFNGRIHVFDYMYVHAMHVST